MDHCRSQNGLLEIAFGSFYTTRVKGLTIRMTWKIGESIGTIHITPF
jgi:hypothetical protein